MKKVTGIHRKRMLALYDDSSENQEINMNLYNSDIYSEKDEGQKACKESELRYIAQKRGFCAQIIDDED